MNLLVFFQKTKYQILIHSRVLIFLVLFLNSFNLSYSQSEMNDLPKKIIDSLINKYEKIPRYTDSIQITVLRVYQNKTDSVRANNSIKTKFIRPYYLELEGVHRKENTPVKIEAGVFYNKKSNEFFAWAKRGNYPLEIKARELEYAFARSTGALGCSINDITCLLLPNEMKSYTPFPDYDIINMLSDEIIRDDECYVIQISKSYEDLDNSINQNIKSQGLTTVKGDKTIYWIRKSDLMILKYKKVVNFENGDNIQVANIYPLLKDAQSLQERNFPY